MKVMEPRPGTKYATVYIVQDPEARVESFTELKSIVNSIILALEADDELRTWFENTSLPGFPLTSKPNNRTALAVVQELLNEFSSTKRDGTPKDIARATVDRWNRLFKDTAWQIELVKK